MLSHTHTHTQRKRERERDQHLLSFSVKQTTLPSQHPTGETMTTGTRIIGVQLQTWFETTFTQKLLLNFTNNYNESEINTLS